MVSRPESSLGWVIAAVILVIVLAGGGVGIWLIVRASKKSKAKKASRRTPVTSATAPAPVVLPPLATVPVDAPAPVVYAPLTTPPTIDLGPKTSSQLGFEEAVARSLATAPTTTPEQQAKNAQSLANWKNEVPLVLTTQQIENKQVQTAKREAAIAVLSAKLKEKKLAKPVEAGESKVPTAAETAKKSRDAKNAAAWAAVGAKLKANKKPAPGAAAPGAILPTATGTAKKARDAKNAAAWAAVGAKLRANKKAAPGATVAPGAILPGGKGNNFVMTMYTFQDNTPSNSTSSASGRTLIPFVSVAMLRRMIKQFGGTINYGDYLHVAFLKGRKMPNGKLHTGWVRVDDFCGDGGDDSYCYQTIAGEKYPVIDLWIGDMTKSGMDTKGKCTGPAGSGQEKTLVHRGNPGASFVTDYGGQSKGIGRCGDTASGKRDHGSCYYYAASASDNRNMCLDVK